jgi:hypothetical protein
MIFFKPTWLCGVELNVIYWLFELPIIIGYRGTRVTKSDKTTVTWETAFQSYYNTLLLILGFRGNLIIDINFVPVLWAMLPMFRRNMFSPSSGSSWNLKMKFIVTYSGLAWLIIVGSRFDDWIYWMSLLQLQLTITAHTLNSILTTSVCRISTEILSLNVWISGGTNFMPTEYTST